MEATQKVNFKAVKSTWLGVQAPLPCTSISPSPAPVRLIGICWAKSSVLGAPVSSNGSPRFPPGRKMSRRHRKGKHGAADPSKELSARRALGQRQSWHHPVLGPRCRNLWWYFLERANKTLRFRQITQKTLFYLQLKMTGNKLMAGIMKREGEEADKVSADLFNMSDRRGSTGGGLYCRTLSSPWILISLSQKTFRAGRQRWSEARQHCCVILSDLRWKMTSALCALLICLTETESKHEILTLFLLNHLFLKYLSSQKWRLNPFF